MQVLTTTPCPLPSPQVRMWTVLEADDRAAHATAALATLATSHTLEVRPNAARGCMQVLTTTPPPSPQVRPNSARGASLHAGAGCACGDTLLSIPLAACVLASEVPEPEWAAVVARVQALGGLEKASDEASVAVREDGRLFVALLRLLDTSARHDASSPSARHDASSPSARHDASNPCLRAQEAPACLPDARAAYFARLAPPERLESAMLAAWEEGSAAARLLRHCVAWHRARAWRRRVEAERLAVLSALNLSTVYWDEARFRWAALLTQTRARRVEGLDGLDSLALCPLIDLAAHASVGPVASCEPLALIASDCL